MATGLISHPACLGHVTPAGHPERVARLEAILRALRQPEFQALVVSEAPQASREALLRAHSAALVDAILNVEIVEGRFARIDGDTAMSSGSREAALRAAGAVIHAVDEVVAGRLRNAFCAVRPPGHHAEHATAMGFCLFNSVAVGALHAQAAHGLARIAVIDFDVHHGNGTQDIFFHNPNLFYASTHQSPLYPGTGSASERGVSGNIINAPLPPGAGSREFQSAFERIILPALCSFGPDLILVSAGFDGHRADPLAQMRLEDEDFGWATRQICAIAAQTCSGRVVSALEGGYDLDALARSAAAHVRALMEEWMSARPQKVPIEELSFEFALKELEDIVARLEQGEVDLEESIALYERGQALKVHCERKLKAAESRLEKIVAGSKGVEAVEPLDLA